VSPALDRPRGVLEIAQESLGLRIARCREVVHFLGQQLCGRRQLGLEIAQQIAFDLAVACLVDERVGVDFDVALLSAGSISCKAGGI